MKAFPQAESATRGFILFLERFEFSHAKIHDYLHLQKLVFLICCLSCSQYLLQRYLRADADAINAVVSDDRFYFDLRLRQMESGRQQIFKNKI